MCKLKAPKIRASHLKEQVYQVLIVLELHRVGLDPLSLKVSLFHGEDVMTEEPMHPLIGYVNTQLVESVVLESLKPSKVQNRECSDIFSAMVKRILETGLNGGGSKESIIILNEVFFF